MRKSGIGFLLGLVGLFFLLSWIFSDRWLESKLESLGSGIVGAKVEFDGVHFSVLRLEIGWNRLQVTDPQATMTNLFETAECAFDLELIPLLSRKYVIENVALQGLQFGTPRESDGKLSARESADSEPPEFIKALYRHLEQETARMPLFNVSQYTRKLNVDSIYALIDLKSPRKIDSLQTVATGKYDDWQQRIDNVAARADLPELQAKITALNPGDVKDVGQLQKSLAAAKNLRQEVEALNKDVQGLKSDFQSEVGDIKNLDNQVSRWIQADFQRALNLAKLPDFSVKNIARILFGRQIIAKIESLTRYVGIARYYANQYQAAAPPDQSPPRLQGQYIHFGKITDIPKFWVKQIALSGIVQDSLEISGTAANIVSDQRVINQPTTLEVGGTRKDRASLQLEAVFNYLGETGKENISLKMEKIPLNNVKLTDFPLLPSKIEQGRGRVTAQFDFAGSDFQSTINFNSSGIRFNPSEKTTALDPKLREISNSLINAITAIDFRVNIRQQAGDFHFSMGSNLDNLIAAELKNIVSGEMQQARERLESKIRQETTQYKEKLQDSVNQYVEDLNSQIAQLENQANQYQDQLTQVQKDIEKQIQDAGKNALKGVFN